MKPGMIVLILVTLIVFVLVFTPVQARKPVTTSTPRPDVSLRAFYTVTPLPAYPPPYPDPYPYPEPESLWNEIMLYFPFVRR